MAECPIEITVTDNGDGTHTITNPNSVAATVDVTPSVAPFPITLPANGSQTVTVPHPGTTSGTFCYPVTSDCDATEPNCDISIVSVVVNPDQQDYAVDDVVSYTVTAENSGDTDVDNFTVDVLHDVLPNTIPTLKCPTGVFTDPTTFVMEFCHDAFPPGVTQKNVDGRIIINGATFDIGNSTVYTTPPGNIAVVYDLVNGPTIPANFPTTGSGTFTYFAYHWDNGQVALNEMPLDSDPSQTRCTVQYNFD